MLIHIHIYSPTHIYTDTYGEGAGGEREGESSLDPPTFVLKVTLYWSDQVVEILNFFLKFSFGDCSDQ